MICDQCGSWNSLDSTYCGKCGHLLDRSKFSIYHFLIQNRDLFVIFGVFGALALYLTTFLNSKLECSTNLNSTANNTSIGISGFSIVIGPYNYNLLHLAIASSLFLALIVSCLLILKAIEVPKGQPFLQSYFISDGSLERLVFLIPFAILIFGILGYMISSYYSEINQIAVIYGYFFGFLAWVFVMVFLFKKLGASWKITIISFVLWAIAGVIMNLLIPKIPSDIIFLNGLFTFDIIFGQGIAFFCLASIPILIYIKYIKKKPLNLTKF
jgi:hypothetical protein